MVIKAKQRARKSGIICDLAIEDIVIPLRCPVLGIPLSWDKERDNLPTLDRIHNGRGYTRDNVVVVSWRANRLKSDATLNKLVQLAEFYSKFRRKT